MVDIRQTSQYAKHLSSIGWKVQRKNGVNYFIKKFPLIGSILKVQRPEKLHLHDIYHVSKTNHCFQIIIEPNLNTDHQSLTTSGFKLSNSPYLPTKTLQLDLKKSKKQLLREMKKDARYAIKKNHELRIKKYELKNLEKFVKSWKSAVGWKRYVPPLSHLVALKKAFGDNCLLYHCTSTVVQSGAIFLKAKDMAYYWQAFTNKEGRKLQAQYKIVWEGILWAKKKSAKIFDFEGVYDERFPNKSWLGFTHFKKSFGGYEVQYPGCFVKTMLPF